MDILIKNMEMPKSCYTCQFGDNYEGSFCLATNDEHHIDHMTAIRRRPKWCPLVAVPPHGRLIDADNLIDDFKKYMCGKCYVINRAGVACEDCFYRDIEKTIAIAPTILEANNGD